MAKIAGHVQRAIDAHTAYEKRCSHTNTLAWLERHRVARGMMGKRSLWCADCGNSIVLSSEEFSALCERYEGTAQYVYTTFPHCGRKLRLQNIKSTHNLECYQELVAIGDYQCIRVWLIEQFARKGQAADVEMYHVYDEMWSKDGHKYIFARRLGFTSMYVWNPFSRTDPGLFYRKTESQWTCGWQIQASRVRSVCEWARQRELHLHHCDEENFQNAFERVLEHDAFAETLWKADSPAFYDYTGRYIGRETKVAIKVAWRHGWQNWERSWFDYIRDLVELGKDFRNPALVAPTDFAKAHDMTVRKVNNKRDKEERERQRAELTTAEQLYGEAYAKFIREFAGVSIITGAIEIRPLPDIKAFYEEAREMRHCVWTRKYYKKANCLIMSARVGDKRKETIEIDTKSWKVLQVHGKCNQNSDSHDVIVKAVTDWCAQRQKGARHA